MENGQLEYPESRAMELSDFKAMDHFAKKSQTIKIGIGNGNNGGGGLVAARRLLIWVSQQLFIKNSGLNPSPFTQTTFYNYPGKI